MYGGGNFGTIRIETASNILQAIIEPGEARANHVHYTTPGNREGMVYGVAVGVDANKTAALTMRVRTDAGNIVPPFFPVQTVFRVPGIVGFIPITLDVPASIPAFTDIWFTAIGDSPNTVVGVTYALLLAPGV